MAVVYRSIVETNITAATASPVVTKPAGVVTGDMMLMFVVTNTGANVSAVAGWALCGAEVDNSTDSTTALLWKIAAADEPATWTMTNMFAATETADFVVIAYSGANAVHKVGTEASLGVTSPGTLSGPSVTPTVDGCMIVQFAGCDPGTGTYAGTPDTSPVGVQRWDAKNSAADSAEYIFIQEYRQGVAGAIALDVTDLATDTYGYHQVALSPTPLTETITLVEASLPDGLAKNGVHNYVRTWTDTASLGHNVLNLAGIILWEALTLTDPTVVAEKGTGPKAANPVETAVLTDTIVNQKNYARTLTESSTLTGSVLKGTGRALTSTMTLADGTVLLGPARVFSSTVTLTEGVTKGTGRVLTSSVTLTESVTKQGTYGRTLTETSVLTDSIRYGNAVNLAETISLADAVARQSTIVRTLTETSVLTDATIGTEKTSGSHAYDTSPVETIVLTDDTLSLVGIGLWETAALSDALLRDTGRALVSTVALADTLAIQTSGKVNISETVVLSDSLVWGRTAARTLSEGTTLSDSPRRDISRAFASTVSLSDTVTTSLAHAVFWVSPVNVAILGGTITKNAGADGYNAGALSIQYLASGNGYVEWTTSQFTIVGLGGGYATPGDWTDIAFGINQAYNFIQIYENGTPKDSFSVTYSPNDRLRVSVEGAAVKYYRNGVLLYTSFLSPTYPLLVDASIFYTDNSVTAWVSGFNGVAPPETVVLTATTSAVKSGTTALLETVALADTLTVGRTAARTFVEAASLTDSIRRDETRTLSSTVALTDSVRKDTSRALVSTLTLAESVRKDTSLILVETSTLADSIRYGNAVNLSETIGLADTLAKIASLYRLTGESIAVSDVVRKSTARALSSTLVLGDGVRKDTSIVLIEASTLTDTLSTGKNVAAVETAVLTDVLVLGLTAARTFTEAATLADAPVTTTLNGGAYDRTWTETVVLSHAVLNLAGIELRETATLTDTLTLPGRQTLTETVTLTDPAVTTVQTPAHYTKQLTDAVVLTDPQLIRGRIYAETVTLSDSITLPGAKSTTRTEGLSLSDSITRVRTAARTLTESASLAATTTKGTGRTLTGAVTLTDTVTLGAAASRVLLEALVLNEAKQLSTARALADAVVLADSLVRGRAAARTLVETLVLGDFLSTQASNAVSVPETVTLGDSLSIGVTAERELTEGVSLGDDLWFGTGRAVTETLGLAGVLTNQTQIVRTLVETLSLSDPTVVADLTHQGSFSKTPTETVLLADSLLLARAAARTLSETVVVTDQATKSVTRVLPIQTVALADSLTLVKALGRSFTETVTLTGSLASQSGNQANLPETLALSDTLTLGRTAARTLLETATLAHTISAAKGGGADLPDPIVLGDTLRKDISRTLTESATLDADVRFETARTLTEGLTLSGLYNASKTGEANSIDVLHLEDACQKDTSRTLTETVALSDSRGRDISREIQESAVLSDLLAQLAGGDRVELVETIVLTDSLIQPGIYIEPVAHFGDQYHTSLTGSQYHTSLTGSQYHTLLSEVWS